MNNSNYIQASNPQKNIWVSASAGSGKTKLLVDRVLRILMQGEDPKSILCLTFTKAAANEMLERIKQRLSEWFLCSEKNLILQLTQLNITADKRNLDLARQLAFKIIDNEDTISISTIHSLCQNILSTFPFETGSNFSNKVLDDNEKKSALTLAKQKLFTSSEDTQTIEKLLQNLNEFTLANLINSLISFENYSFEWIDIKENMEEFCKRIDRFYNPPKIDEVEYFEKSIKSEINKLLHDNRDIIHEIKILDSLNNKLGQKNEYKLECVQEIFFNLNNSPKTKILLKKEEDLYPKTCNGIITLQERIISYFEKKNAYISSNISKEILRLKSIFSENYNKVKSDLSAIDFNDIISKTFFLLNNTELKDWVTYRIGHNIRHLLVDESQDISIPQWKIIFALTDNFFYSDDTSIFIVGDEKQSIYSFQGASPSIYSAIERIYQEKYAKNEKKLEKIYLNYSFRSGQKILDFVDSVFKNIKLSHNISLSSDYKNHLSKANCHLNHIEIFPLISSPVNKKKPSYEWKTPLERGIQYCPAKKNATVISKQIFQLISCGAEPKDIMVLVQKRDDFTKHLIFEIKRLDIPITGIDKILLNDHLAVLDLIAFAEFLLHPYDDLNLACLLKSPLFGLTDEDLFHECIDKDTSLWDQLKLSKKQHIINSVKMLSDYVNLEKYNHVFDLYFDLLIYKNYKQKFLNRFGNNTDDILEEFLKICSKYQDTHTNSLQLFLNWFTNCPIEIKRSFDSTKNEVRLLTTHAAKGLQSKIVILANAASTPSMTDNLFWDEDNNLPAFGSFGAMKTFKYNESREVFKSKLFDEYLRLLYVALTRAKEMIFIFAHSNQSEANVNSWYHHIINTSQLIAKKETLSEIFGLKITDNSEDNTIYTANKYKYVFSNYETNHKMTVEPSSTQQCFDKLLIPEKKIMTSSVLSDKTTSNIDYFSAQKGKLIHKLLEILISHHDTQETTLKSITKISNLYNVELTREETDQFLEFYLNICDIIAPGDQIKKEQAILLNEDNQYKKGIIDLMIIKPREILLVDYKNSKYSEDLVMKYTEQLSFYKKSISTIYQDHSIACYIAWIKDLFLEKVD